ncbi:YncE family protein [Pseudomonas veronii]|uniref:YncE family protein n=1 Tax=Pseudomonas TaxID=286 RepID=UPI000F831E94|nr:MULTISPECIES: YncE family protein [Pseudomonas]MDY7551756.1 YncE family protein [Pseudomonas sp. FG1]MEB0051286.1 YncE family protein [Pseudomonas sp. FG1]RTY67474.1 YncE family protein [Pseudomonas veronii]
MTFDQDTDAISDDNTLPALIAPSHHRPGGLMPNELFPDDATSGIRPFSDLVVLFPTETKPVSGHDAAFNAAALTVNTNGVICLLPGYLNKAEHDFIWIEINGVRGPIHTVTQEEIDLDQLTLLFMDAGRFIDQANNTVQVFVEHLSGTTDSTRRFNYLADREPPVGRDPIVSTPYNDNMSPVRFTNPQIEDFRVITDADISAGVKIQIGNYPLDRAEPQVHHRKEDDVIHLSIGGVIIKHTVTSFEASGNNPITITAYFGTWNQLPNGAHLVEWFVVDKAGNKSPGFSPSRMIELRVGSGVEPLLSPVHVTESDYDPDSEQDFINVPDLDGDATIELPIRGQGYSVNDKVILTVSGLSADGVRTEITLEYDVQSINVIRALIPLPLSFLRPLAGGRILITYKRVRPGTPDRHSEGALYNIFGDPVSQRLPPPEVQDLVNGALPEDTNPVRIVVPHYFGQNPNDRVDLIVLGHSANGTSTYAEYTEMAGNGDVEFLLDNAFFTALSGGYFEAHYLINRGNPRPASEKASVPVGDALEDLPAPTTLQAVAPDFTFNPLIHKANLNVRVRPHPAIVAGTELRLIFVGSAPGGSFTSPWFAVDINWEDAEIPFTVPRNIVLNNDDGTARLYYELKPISGPNRFSLDLLIKIGTPRTLLLPQVVPTTFISDTRVELNPTHVIAPQPQTIEIRVISDKLPRDADIKVNIKGKSGIGNPNIPAKPAVPEAGENYTRFELSSDFVAAYLDGEFTVSYQLIESSGTTISGDLTVEVLALPSSLLDLVTIPEASGGTINTAVANNVRIDKWPFFRAGQPVWIQLLSTTNRDLRLAVGVTSAEFNAGRTLDLIPASYLSGLENNSEVAVKAWVSLDGSNSLETAKYFKVPTYVTRKGSGEIIRHITVGNGPNQIAISRDGNTVCVLNARAYSVSVINFASGAIRTLAYNYVYRLALHPTEPRLFLSANTGLGANYQAPVLNLSTFTFSYPFAFSYSAAYAIGINPTGSRMFIGLLASGSSLAFSVFDTTSGQYVTNFGGTAGPRSIVTNPQGTAIFTTGYNTERYTLSSGVRTHTVVNGAVAQELAHTGFDAPLERLYVSVSGLNKLDIYNTENDSLTFIKSLTGLSDPRGIAFHPTRPLAYVSELAGNRVRVIDMNSETLIGTINGFDQPNGLACTPDGQYLLVCNSGNTTVAVVSI